MEVSYLVPFIPDMSTVVYKRDTGRIHEISYLLSCHIYRVWKERKFPVLSVVTLRKVKEGR